MANRQGVISVSLDPDLYSAVIKRCETNCVKPSHVIRAFLRQWIVGHAPTVEDSYQEARKLALELLDQFAHKATSRAAEELPATYDEFLKRQKCP